MKTKMPWSILMIAFFFLVLTANPVAAQDATETAPEASPSSTVEIGKIVWDIDLRITPQEFNTFIKAIRRTYDDLIQEGIEPDMVIVFRGLAVNFSGERSGSGYSPKIQKENIRLVGELQNLPGVRMEADKETMQGAPGEARSVLPGIKEIDNVFITLIKHQSEGYQLITIN